MKGFKKTVAVILAVAIVFMMTTMFSAVVAAEDEETVNMEMEEVSGNENNMDIEPEKMLPEEEKEDKGDEGKTDKEAGDEIKDVSLTPKELTDVQTPMPASVTATGSCGDNLTWSLETDGTLTISGSGEMDSFSFDYYIYEDDIKSVIIEDGVTTIGASAFSHFSNLTEITIPSSVTSIGDWAFSGCSGLEKITFPPSVTTVGYGLFYNCGLKEFPIMPGVTTIRTDMFFECDFTEAVLSSNVTKLEIRGFNSCRNLKKVIFPPNMESMEGSSFLDCLSIEAWYFLGDAVDLVSVVGGENYEPGPAFKGYFPYDNSTWTEEKRSALGNNIIWMAWNPANDLAINLSLTDNLHWIGNGSDATIVCTGEYADFVSAAMDGVLMDASQYSARAGSTVLTIMSQYMDTLAVGDHRVTLNYTYGSIDTNLKILDKGTADVSASAKDVSASANHPVAAATGDTSKAAVWLFTACVSGSVLLALKRKRAVS